MCREQGRMARIDEYFIEMKERGASDLHMVIGFPPMLRLRGELTPTNHTVLTPESNRDLLFEMLNDNQQATLESHRDFDMAYELEGVARFRCNFLYQHRGVGKDNIMYLEISERDLEEETLLSREKRVQVELTNHETLDMSFFIEMPEERSRVSDYLHFTPRFIYLCGKEKDMIVNKTYVFSVKDL